MTGKPTAASSESGALGVLLLVVFINIAGFGIVIPLLPFYAETFGIAAWQVTLLFSVYSIGQFLGEPFWGRLSDRIGRRPVLLITMAAIALGYVLLAFVPNYYAAVLLRLASGFAGGNISVSQAYIADISSPEKRVSRLGLLGAAFGVGFMVGPALGGLLVDTHAGPAGFRLPMLAAAGMSLLSVIGIAVLLRESRHVGEAGGTHTAAWRMAWHHPVLRQVLITTLAATGALSAMEAIYGLWTAAKFGWGPHEVGLTFALIGALSALCQGLLVGRVTNLIGEAKALALGLFLTGVSLLAQVFAPSGTVLVAITVLTVVGISLTNPAISGLISRSTAQEHQGAMLGVNGGVSAFARISGPLVAGALFSTVGIDAPYVFAAVGVFFSVILALHAGRLVERGTPPAQFCLE